MRILAYRYAKHHGRGGLGALRVHLVRGYWLTAGLTLDQIG